MHKPLMKYINDDCSFTATPFTGWDPLTYAINVWPDSDFNTVDRFKALLEEYKKLKKLSTPCDKCERFNLSEIDKNRFKYLESLLKDFI